MDILHGNVLVDYLGPEPLERVEFWLNVQTSNSECRLLWESSLFADISSEGGDLKAVNSSTDSDYAIIADEKTFSEALTSLVLGESSII